MNKGYYAIIPANVRYDKDLSANCKLLYGEITALCNEKGYCWATNNYFAELYGTSKETISRWISKLVERNYIFSEIIYKDGTKEIDSRILKVVNTPIDENVNTPIDENVNTPIDENVKGNNTSINNTSIIKEKDISNKLDISKKKKETVAKKFIKPTVDEVRQYCLEANINIDANRFIDFYESKGWRVGSAAMKDWKAALRNWARRDNMPATSKNNTTHNSPKTYNGSYEYGSFDLADIEARVQNGFMSRDLAEQIKSKYKQNKKDTR